MGKQGLSQDDLRLRSTVRDTIIRRLSTWLEARLTRKQVPREDVILFLAQLSPEERTGIYKLRTFHQRYNRGKRRVPAAPVRINGVRNDALEAWRQPSL